MLLYVVFFCFWFFLNAVPDTCDIIYFLIRLHYVSITMTYFCMKIEIDVKLIDLIKIYIHYETEYLECCCTCRLEFKTMSAAFEYVSFGIRCGVFCKCVVVLIVRIRTWQCNWFYYFFIVEYLSFFVNSPLIYFYKQACNTLYQTCIYT